MITVDPLSLWPTPTSFVVTLACRDRLARTTGLRPCHTMDPDLERLICELRDLSDRHVLSSVAGGHRGEDVSVTEAATGRHQWNDRGRKNWNIIETSFRNTHSSHCNTPLNTWRNNNVVITSKRRHFDVITSKWRRLDVIATSLLRNVFAGTQAIINWSTVNGVVLIAKG